MWALKIELKLLGLVAGAFLPAEPSFSKTSLEQNYIAWDFLEDEEGVQRSRESRGPRKGGGWGKMEQDGIRPLQFSETPTLLSAPETKSPSRVFWVYLGGPASLSHWLRVVYGEENI